MSDVSALIAARQTEAESLSRQANTFLQALQDITNVQFADGFNIDTLLPKQYNYSAVPSIDYPIFYAVAPSINSTTAEPPSSPTISVSDVADVPTPEFLTTDPVLSFPAAPSSALPSSPGAAPSFVSPDLPTAPVVSLPAVPTLAALALPTPPPIDLPSFDGVLPTDDLVTPTATFQFYETAYDSTLLDPLKAKLLDNLQNGGYGIETADEVALFNRARDREVEAALTRISEAGRLMALRGFPLPPGELAIHVDRAWQDMQDKVAAGSREITLERSKLYVDNRQFTIREAHEIEQIAIGFHNSVQERALNVARTTVEMGIALYNTLLNRFKARLEAYQAQAQVFTERIRGELAKAEIYRTEVEASNVQAQVQRQQVEIYRAQLDGIQASVNIYRTGVEAANVQASIERQKLEAFRAAVESYTSQVQAKVAEFNAYRAQIDGEVAKVNAFEAQVRAFNGKVSAAEVKSRVQLGKLQAENETARTKLANYQAQIAGYEAGIRNQLESGRLKVQLFDSQTRQFESQNTAQNAKAALQEKALEATVQQNIQISAMTIDNVKAKLQATVEALKFRTAAVQYGSEKFFALLTAIQSSISTLAAETATM